jgi:hypothetical protein
MPGKALVLRASHEEIRLDEFAAGYPPLDVGLVDGLAHRTPD